ncbi:MAG: hypothetical protein ACFFAU_08610 [Candidatus Hodarchaeota archaeon]
MVFQKLKIIIKAIIEDNSGFFRESLSLNMLMLGALGLIMIFATIGETEPARIQNMLLLTFGSFGVYLFFMRTFFANENDRSMRMKRHIGFLLTLTIVLTSPGLIAIFFYQSLNIEYDFEAITSNGFFLFPYLFITMFLVTIMLFALYLSTIEVIREQKIEKTN